MTLVGRGLDAVMALLFVFSAAVQYNDPDPVQWVAVYLAAAVVSALSAAGRARRWASAVVCAVSLGWALTLLPRVVGTPGFPTFAFGDGMKTDVIEETREAFGLLIAALWAGLVTARARPRAPPALTRGTPARPR